MVVLWWFMGFYGIYPLVMTNRLLWKITIDIWWICPWKIGIFHRYVSHYQRVHLGVAHTIVNIWTPDQSLG